MINAAPYPELIVDAGRVPLDEGAVVGGDVPVVTVLLQHVDLSFDLLFLILETETEGPGVNVTDELSGRPAWKGG